ncbi:MAG: cobalamin biosynthesis protein CobD [Tissierellia bacterium]|nr:cobalamin biosynthesis protein CobD [Tissierellia bacterium]
MTKIILGVILDLLLGDPYSLPHPIKLMGRIISFEEKIFRSIFKTELGLVIAGFLMVLINVTLGIFPIYFLLKNTKGIVNYAIYVITYYYCISARMLHYESMEVKKALEISLAAGRERVKYIVGRDTANLDEKEIVRATVETVAENTSDGVIAPLFYIILFGPMGGLAYKFINTMDSMVAYKNEKYFYLGKVPAIVDDIANFIPARITAFIMCLTELSPRKIQNAMRIVLRDGRNHTSPNAGFPEAAVAAILGVQLGGGQFYNGVYVEKPTLGDRTREIGIGDIFKTSKIMYKTEILFLIFILILNLM